MAAPTQSASTSGGSWLENDLSSSGLSGPRSMSGSGSRSGSSRFHSDRDKEFSSGEMSDRSAEARALQDAGKRRRQSQAMFWSALAGPEPPDVIGDSDRMAEMRQIQAAMRARTRERLAAAYAEEAAAKAADRAKRAKGKRKAPAEKPGSKDGKQGRVRRRKRAVRRKAAPRKRRR